MPRQKTAFPNINGRQLEAFRAVVLAGTVSSAAVRMGISQPAVSRLIIDLERSIGFPLFERVKRRLLIRPEARILYQEIEHSFVGVEKIAQRAVEIRDYKTGHIRIAGMPAVSLGLLPQIVSSFRKTYPDISISIQIRSSQKVTEWISSQQYDLGLAAPPLSSPGISIDTIYSLPCVCILPATHKLATRRTISPKLLSGETFISLGSDSVLRLRIDQAFQKSRVTRRMEVETTMSVNALLLVELGIGISIIDPFTASRFRNKDIAIRPFLPSIPYEFAMLSPTNIPKSRSVELFAEFCKQQIGEFSRNFNRTINGSRAK